MKGSTSSLQRLPGFGPYGPEVDGTAPDDKGHRPVQRREYTYDETVYFDPEFEDEFREEHLYDPRPIADEIDEAGIGISLRCGDEIEEDLREHGLHDLADRFVRELRSLPRPMKTHELLSHMLEDGWTRVGSSMRLSCGVDLSKTLSGIRYDPSWDGAHDLSTESVFALLEVDLSDGHSVVSIEVECEVPDPEGECESVICYEYEDYGYDGEVEELATADFRQVGSIDRKCLLWTLYGELVRIESDLKTDTFVVREGEHYVVSQNEYYAVDVETARKIETADGSSAERRVRDVVERRFRGG